MMRFIPKKGGALSFNSLSTGEYFFIDMENPDRRVLYIKLEGDNKAVDLRNGRMMIFPPQAVVTHVRNVKIEEV